MSEKTFKRDDDLWEECRACGGLGELVYEGEETEMCPACRGSGSVRKDVTSREPDKK